jgi:hypothetical protein
MAGLIDRLDIYYPAGVDYFDATSEWYSRDDLRAMLRSDETREALAREIQQHRKDEASFRPSTCSCAEWESWEQPWREHLADAVLRVLAGGAE